MGNKEGRNGHSRSKKEENILRRIRRKELLEVLVRRKECAKVGQEGKSWHRKE